MKTLIGVSAVLAAGLNLSSRAAERGGPDMPPRLDHGGIRLAQSGGANLPFVRVLGVSGETIELNLRVPADGVRFLKLREFPEGLKLSHGFRIRGSWIASATDIEQLRLVSPPGLVGTVKLDLEFFRDNESAPVAQRVVLVEVRAPDSPQQPDVTVTATLPRPVPERTPPPLVLKSAEQLEREIEGLERGRRLMRSGDIAAARLMFEDLALSGSAKGARALAETYDPAHLKDMFIAGLQPNLETAKKWYRRAAELGDTESVTRLSALD